MRRRQAERAWRAARAAEVSEPAPPFFVGQPVRCAVSTLDRGPWPARVELRGRAGVVVRMLWIRPRTRPGYWDIQVRYDHLGWPNLPRHHRPEDLEPA